tara:strand:+ start:99 stop:620 length:522 start_codon:yes stop_codon:yes gene_type:complete
MKKYYVYKHTDKDKVVYIGMGTNGRAWEVYKRSPEHSKFIVKCLHKNISSIEVIKYFNNKSDTYKYESKLINYYKPKYNKTWTQAYKDLISCKGRKVSLATISKISQSQKGEKGFWYGKKQPQEMKHKRMISNNRRNIITFMGKTYNSIRECSRITKIPYSSLNYRLKNSVRS